MGTILMLVLGGFVVVDVLWEHMRHKPHYDREDSHRRLMHELHRHGDC